MYLCRKHFLPTDFIPRWEKECKRLKVIAVPTQKLSNSSDKNTENQEGSIQIETAVQKKNAGSKINTLNQSERLKTISEVSADDNLTIFDYDASSDDSVTIIEKSETFDNNTAQIQNIANVKKPIQNERVILRKNTIWKSPKFLSECNNLETISIDSTGSTINASTIAESSIDSIVTSWSPDEVVIDVVDLTHNEAKIDCNQQNNNNINNECTVNVEIFQFNEIKAFKLLVELNVKVYEMLQKNQITILILKKLY